MGYEVEILGLTYYSRLVYKPYRDEFNFKTIHSFDDIRWVIINGIKYILVSSIISITFKKKQSGHAIAGLICDNIEYLYDSNNEIIYIIMNDVDTEINDIIKENLIYCLAIELEAAVDLERLI